MDGLSPVWMGYLLYRWGGVSWRLGHHSFLHASISPSCTTTGLCVKTEVPLTYVSVTVSSQCFLQGKNHLLQFVLRFLLTFKGHLEPFSSLPDGDRIPGRGEASNYELWLFKSKTNPHPKQAGSLAFLEKNDTYAYSFIW